MLEVDYIRWKQVMKTMYYTTPDKWEWRAFDGQVEDYIQSIEPWPEQNRLYLNAQQVLLDRGADEGVEVRTKLKRLNPTYGNVILLALFQKLGHRDLQLKLFIDRHRMSEGYTGCYYRPPQLTENIGAVEKRFRCQSPTGLMAVVLREFDDLPPMDFCTLIGD